MRNGPLILGALAIGAGAGIISLWERPIAKAVGLPPPPDVIPDKGRQRIILCFGDSLSAGTAKAPAYWKYIKPSGDTLVSGIISKDSKGWGGKQIAFILSESKKVVEKVHPTDVVLLAGVNNVASQKKVEKIITDLQAAWDYYHAQGARVIAVKLTPWFGYPNYFGAGKPTAQPFRDATNAVNAYIDSRRGKSGGPEVVVDTSALGDESYALKKEYSAGGLHMSNGGKRALAALVAKAL
jgi:lysophospholipase L1-like esterase